MMNLFVIKLASSVPESYDRKNTTMFTENNSIPSRVTQQYNKDGSCTMYLYCTLFAQTAD